MLLLRRWNDLAISMWQNDVPGWLASRKAEQEHRSKEDCCQPSNRILITKQSHSVHHVSEGLSDTTQMSRVSAMTICIRVAYQYKPQMSRSGATRLDNVRMLKVNKFYFSPHLCYLNHAPPTQTSSWSLQMIFHLGRREHKGHLVKRLS